MADVFLLNGYRKGKFIFDIRQMFETKFFVTHKYAFYMAKYSKKLRKLLGRPTFREAPSFAKERQMPPVYLASTATSFLNSAGYGVSKRMGSPVTG